MADYRELLKKTKLYELLQKKTDDHGFLEAVEDLCKEGDALSSQIYSFFPTFTRHDYKHILGVCDWMGKLLDSMEGEKSSWEVLTAEEAALLLLAAHWHDSGMAVTVDQKKELLRDMEAREGEWAAYFEAHPEDENALADAKEEAREAERERILRNYVREHHASRCDDQLPLEKDWPPALKKHGIYRKHLVALCTSHGTDLKPLESNKNRNFDLRLCVVLLRLADLLDYDASRAPESLLRFLGLDHPETDEEKKSREEWNQNNTGEFQAIEERKILYHATFTDPQTEHKVRKYLGWVNDELRASQDYLSTSEWDRWRHFRLPYRVDDATCEREGYDGGDFCITMDQDRVLTLLTGENLYDDPGVFVRELLQNSIDAVLERRKQDRDFGEQDGQITVRCWQEGDGKHGWFRIEDNGIGMDKHIIQDYFLRVGHSYYDSEEYRAAARHPAHDTGDRPISRFGIGILSCFMTDPDTRLEVSTRRYGAKAPLRMDVHGLHGFYALTTLSKDRPGTPLSAPYRTADKTEYKRGVGTTICVRVNLLRLGRSSFRELLDKYLSFPEVKVTYYDEKTPNGYAYLTQQELMDRVRKFNNPDGTVKEYDCPFSDSLFDRVKEELPGLDWTERPDFTVAFRPLEGVSQDISGVEVRFGFRGSAEGKKKIKDDDGQLFVPKYELSAVGHFRKKAIGLEASWDPSTKARCKKEHHPSESTDVSFQDLLHLLTADVKQMLSLLWDSPLQAEANSNFAFNGVVAGRITRYSDLFYTVLLRGESRPTVNLARNAITDLPLDTACALDLLDIPLPVEEENFALLPERSWREVLEKNPSWEALLRLDELRDGEDFKCRKDSVIAHLRLAALRRQYEVRLSRDKKLRLSPRPESPPSELPLSLLVPPEKEEGLGEIGYFGITINTINRYSQTHPFSLWLREKQEGLREDAPAIYRDLIKTMVLGKDADAVRTGLNNALDRLANFRGNPFDISEALYPKEGYLK